MMWTLFPAIATMVLSGCAAFDGYWSAKAQATGHDYESGVASAFFGSNPTKAALLYKGGAIILAELGIMWTASILTRTEPYASLVFSIPLFVQSVFHIYGGLSGIKIVEEKA